MSHQEFFQELKKDHSELKEMIQQMKSQSSQEASGMVMQMKRELKPHQEAEEQTFYKSLVRIPDVHRLALKAEEEHHVAENVLDDLEKTPSGDQWEAKLDVLEELVKEHIQEEESKVFEAARSINESEIDDILQNFQRKKIQIKSDMMTGTIREEDTRSSALPDEDLGTIV